MSISESVRCVSTPNLNCALSSLYLRVYSILVIMIDFLCKVSTRFDHLQFNGESVLYKGLKCSCRGEKRNNGINLNLSYKELFNFE